MTNTQGVVSEDVGRLITYGQRVYDSNGNKVGTVALYDIKTGWMTVEKGAFVHRDLYIPFSVISNIDPREIYLSLSKDDVLALYASPPPRTTRVEHAVTPDKGTVESIAVSTVPSGYTSTAVQVDSTNLDEIKGQIALGMRLFDIYGDRVGTIEGYNTAHGYMRVKQSMLLPKDLYIPVSLVDSVDLDGRDVHLAVSRDHLKRLYIVPPEGTSFAETTVIPSD